MFRKLSWLMKLITKFISRETKTGYLKLIYLLLISMVIVLNALERLRGHVAHRYHPMENIFTTDILMLTLRQSWTYFMAMAISSEILATEEQKHWANTALVKQNYSPLKQQMELSSQQCGFCHRILIRSDRFLSRVLNTTGLDQRRFQVTPFHISTDILW